MSLLFKSLRFALLALLVGVCVAQTATAREEGGRRSKKSSGGGYSSASYNPQPTPAPKTTPTTTPTTPLPTLTAVPSTPVTTNTGSIDLVLEDLNRTAEATPVAGP